MKNAINVTSEIGKLKKVLLHRPGTETENIVPSTYEEMLFDDAYYLPEAQREHDVFASKLKENGVEVVYLEDLVASIFEDKTIKDKFLEQFIVEAGIEKTSSLFGKVLKYTKKFKDNKELVVKIMGGVAFKELDQAGEKSLAEMVYDERFVLKPMPNLIFTRDPFASIGTGISLHSMLRETRKRETIFSEYIFTYHPEYKKVKQYSNRYEGNQHIEGGDVMILNKTSIAVGISQRTSADAVEALARKIFADKNSTIKTIYGVNIPKGRSWMHLDTVFTQIDKDKFSIFTNYPFQIYKITDKNGKLNFKVETKKIDEIMKEVFGKKVKLFQCGDGDPFIAEREQWNDGSNVLAIAPNTIIAYDRNYVTNGVLKAGGVNVIEIPSYELSRGRGGPRCMSMPLIREEI